MGSIFKKTMADKNPITALRKDGHPKRLKNKGDAVKKAARRKKWKNRAAVAATALFPAVGTYLAIKGRNKAYNNYK